MSPVDHQSWEYRVVHGADDETMNALGRDGWELVGIAAGGGPVLTFKRPLPSFREQVTLDQKRRYYGQWGITASEDEGSAAR